MVASGSLPKPFHLGYRALRDTTMFRNLLRTRLVQNILHLKALAGNPGYREWNSREKAEFERFCSQLGGAKLGAKLLPPGKHKRALVHHVTIPYVKLQVLLEKALQTAGFECVTVGARSRDFLRYDWLLGNSAGYLFSDFDISGDPEWVERQMPRLMSTRDWLGLRYRNVRVGQFVIATALRWRMVGQLDFTDGTARSMLAELLNASVRNVIAASDLLDEVQPDCLLLMDRGYSGAGELFDLALHRRLDVITWNFGYKSNRLVLKRYNSDNDRDHPLCPSAASWSQVRTAAWNPSYGDAIRQELFDCYESGDLFSFSGTQFNKKILSRDATRRELGLAADKKVAVIFPHILWDGSFFYGEDLFEDYTEWLVETIKAACDNDRVQWVVKLHPAHVVKAERENYRGKPAELVALEGVVETLPEHVKLVHPGDSISTYSLLETADYVVTVRGTVGIEAALLGVPVVTGGTGRYDRRGFTIDSSSQEEYKARLAKLETYPPLTKDQIELAERYAYYVFLCRPLRLSCASLEYARDAKASPIVTVHCNSPEEWAKSPDVVSLGEWFRNGVDEDFIGAPFDAIASERAQPLEHATGTPARESTCVT